MQDKIKDLISQSIQDRIFPGATVLVGNNRDIEFLQSFGTTMYDDPDSKPVTPDMLYDIASITKVFTATAIFKLIDSGIISLDSKIGDLIPELEPDGKKPITVKQLLTHNSGLSLKFHSLSDFPSKQIRHHLLHDPLIAVPGTKVLYDNANGMMLAEVVTSVSGKKFIDYLSDEVLIPVGLQNTMFNPPKDRIDEIVPTETDSWRMRLVHGEVHDESAYAMGGIAGHAGLFSTAEDLWKFANLWLHTGEMGNKRLLSAQIVNQATCKQVDWDHGPIGFEWRIDNQRVTDHAPKGTYNHTGFTGTALIICPKKNKIIVLLTNYIYPKRPESFTPLFNVRKKLSEIILSDKRT